MWPSDQQYRSMKRVRSDNDDPLTNESPFEWEQYVQGSDVFKYVFQSTILIRGDAGATYIPSTLLIGSSLPTNPTNFKQVIVLPENSTIEDVQIVARINLEFLCKSYGVISTDKNLDIHLAANFTGVLNFLQFSENTLVMKLLEAKTDFWARKKVDLHDQIKHHLREQLFRDIVTFCARLPEYKVEAAKNLPVPNTHASALNGGVVYEIDGFSSLSGFSVARMKIVKGELGNYVLTMTNTGSWEVNEEPMTFFTRNRLMHDGYL